MIILITQRVQNWAKLDYAICAMCMVPKLLLNGALAELLHTGVFVSLFREGFKN